MTEPLSDIDHRPHLQDFVNYLPWACVQLRVELEVHVFKTTQTEYVSAERPTKGKQAGKSLAKIHSNTHSEKEEKSNLTLSYIDHSPRIVKIYAVCDIVGNVVQLKFAKNSLICRSLVKVMALIIPFQPYLNILTINLPMNQPIVYELSKMLSATNITELCLDDAILKEGTYYIILDVPNQIKNLSLARCNIDDEVLQKLMSTLKYPQPSSKTLCILNLATNKITDLGATYIADMLRENRKLLYLNISDNMLHDEGAYVIFYTLVDFLLNQEEIFTMRLRLVDYLRRKNELINKLCSDLQSGNFDKKDKTTKPFKSVPAAKKAKGLEKESSLRSVPDAKVNVDIEKATMIAESRLGEFDDPYGPQNVYTKDETVYCYGNNTLCYLNLSYNNLTYMSVKKVLEVLEVQKRNNRKPQGLIKLNIEGNNLPLECKEFNDIDYFLDMGLSVTAKGSVNTRSRSVGNKK